MVVKIEVIKAYDKIEWSFLQFVMEMMGFNQQWIGLIMEYITSISYSVLVNGAPQPFF